MDLFWGFELKSKRRSLFGLTNYKSPKPDRAETHAASPFLCSNHFIANISTLVKLFCKQNGRSENYPEFSHPPPFLSKKEEKNLLVVLIVMKKKEVKKI